MEVYVQIKGIHCVCIDMYLYAKNAMKIFNVSLLHI